MSRTARNSVARITEKAPVFEHIMTAATESFLWRLDDYPWERNIWNFHPEYEIHLIRNASGVELVGDHIGSFDPGHLSIVGGGLPHDWVTAVKPGERIPGRDIVLQFDPGRLGKAADFLPEMAEIDDFFKRSLRGITFHGETRRRATRILEHMGQLSGLERFSEFLRLLVLMARSTEYDYLSSEHYMPNLNSQTLDIVQRALAYIFENFASDTKLSDLAEMLGMSESAFSRLFKKNSGNSFTDHVSKLRISRACKLLADSDTPITDICFEVGYSNISNFNRIFRKQRGTTPSAYRRLAQRRVQVQDNRPAPPSE